MCHQRDERCLAKKRTLTTHIWAGENNDLLRIWIEYNIVGNVVVARRKISFNHWVSRFDQFQFKALVYERLLVIKLQRSVRETTNTIENSENLRVLFYRMNKIFQFRK